ncbi:MAG: hypothetical protein JWO33_570 [Caulobacteraceae bacterium]|nr:hypothetical protein [Caulobacteraceae bacterium]
MTTSNSMRGPAAQADRLARAAFETLKARPVPDHLVRLVDELEAAGRTGRLRKPSQAA